MYPRKIEKQFKSWLIRDEILILTGARQVGKSTFLKSIFNELNNNKLFYNLEDLEILGLFNESPKNLVRLIQEKFNFNEKVYIFIDEIQYLSNPTNFLKYIYDEYKDKIKLIVSGSSAFYIDEKFSDSLAGRKKIFNLYPLSFDEFLLFKGEGTLSSTLSQYSTFTKVTQNEINQYFIDYSIYGGYPKIVLEKNIDIKKELIGELVNSYIKKDIAESKIEHIDKFYSMYKILCSQTGNIMNSNELANTLGLSHTAIKNYLYVLKKTFHIFDLKPFYKNVRKELTKMPKIYIHDLGIKNYFEKNFNNLNVRNDKGAIFETILFNHLKIKYGLEHINYRRTQNKQEIDFIITGENQKIAIESKYNLINSKNNLNVFISAYPEYDGKVINIENIFDLLYS